MRTPRLQSNPGVRSTVESELNGEIGNLGAFFQGRRKPARLTATAGPGFAGIIAIAILDGNLAAFAAARTEDFTNGNAALGGECHNIGLEFVLLANFCRRNRLFYPRLEIEQFLERELVYIDAGHERQSFLCSDAGEWEGDKRSPIFVRLPKKIRYLDIAIQKELQMLCAAYDESRLESEYFKSRADIAQGTPDLAGR